MSQSELEPVVFEVIAEIAGAQASLAQIQEELVSTATQASESGAEMDAALTDAAASLMSVASAAAESSAIAGASVGAMGASFGDAADDAAGASNDISSSLGDIEGALGDASGAAADAYQQMSDSMSDVESEAESAAGAIDDSSNEMSESFNTIGGAVEATAGHARALAATVDGAMATVAAASEGAAAAVVAANEEIAASSAAAGTKMVEEGAKAKTMGAEAAEAGHKGALGMKEMAEAFGAFAAFEFLKDSIKDALSAEGAMNILNTAIEKTGESARAMAPEVENVDEHMRALGFGAAESNEGLAKLTQMLGNSQQAMRMEGLAADLARAKHIDLGAAIRTVGMAATGHVGLLARLGLQTKDAAGKTLSAKAAIDAMSHSFAGTAQSYSTTMAGKMQAFKADMEEAREKVGNALIPALEKLTPMFVELANIIAKDVAPALAAVANYYAKHKKTVDVLVGAMALLWASFKIGAALAKAYEFLMGTMTAVTELYAIAVGEAEVAQGALDAELLANPIGLVIAAIVALAAVFIYAWKHSETFRDIVKGTWSVVEKATGTAVAAIINYYVRPLVAAYLWMAQAVVGAADKAFGWIPGLGGKLDDAKNAVQDFAKETDSTLESWADNASKWGDKHADAIKDAHKKTKASVTEDKDPFGNYSSGLSNSTAAGTAAAASAAKKHRAAELAAEKKHQKEMLDEAKKAAKAREEVLKQQVVAAKAAAAAQAAVLKQQLAQTQQAFDFAKQQLEAQNQASVQMVNGQLSNVGLSFLNLGYAASLGQIAASQSPGAGAAPQVVNINVAGSVVTEQQLVGTVAQGLLTLQRTNSNIGIKAS